MTNEQAKSELMQIYMSLSEEKKQAIDVLMAQNCDQCEVGNPCLYCEHEFKTQADGEYILKSEAIRVASGYCHPSNIAKELEKLPSVAIPNKVGHWKPFDRTFGRSIYACSVCNTSADVPTSMGEVIYKYCPNCGAKMGGEEDG